MKKFYTTLLILFATLSFSQSYTRYYNSWRLGMNMGGMWQISDMKSYAGIAGGLTLEKGFGENKTNFFSWAVKLRWLSGRTSGLNFNRNYDVKNNAAYNGSYNPKVNYADSVAPSKRYVYDNYHTPISEGALELQLEFNRLREQTHIIFNLWGGIGFSGFRANSNLLDANGKMYDFSKMDSSGTSSALSSIAANMDGSSESWALGSKQKDIFTFSPSGGIGLGYQVSPGFSIIFEYKVTVPMGSKADLLDGVLRGNNDWLGGNNDYYKYAGLNLKFTLGGKGRSTSTHTSVTDPNVYTSAGTRTVPPHTNSVVSTNTNVAITDLPPIVNITNPPYSPFNTYTNNFEVKAKVYNVNSRNEIYVTFNGQTITNFNYNFNTKDLSFFSNLNIGPNYLIITASNKAGTDTKSATINLQGAPPEIIISNPSSDPYTSNNPLANVDAVIKNVTSSNNVYVKFNGNPISFFNFNPQNLQFFVQLNLNKGSNILEITATNDFGKDYESQTIIYNPFTIASNTVASRPVTVIITDPATSPYTVKQSSYNVKSKVTGVNSAGQVTVSVNGINIPFNYNSGIVTFNTALVVGANYVTVSAANESSADSKSTIIIYEEQRVPTPPAIVITNPPSSPYTSNVASFTFKAQTKNIHLTNQILAKFNGNQISNYSFNTTTGEIEFYTALTINANNVFEVTVTNQDGSANASAIVIYHELIFDPLITICDVQEGVKKSVTIKQSEWPTYKLKGASLGECPKEEPLIVICHTKEDGAKQTLTVKRDDWPVHQAHGDHLGECTSLELDPEIIICHKSGGTSSTIKIKQSEWKTHQMHGDNLGICMATTEDVNITICSKNPDGTYQTLSIKQSEWPQYQAAGAHLGACTAEELDPSILICAKQSNNVYQTITIKKSQWPQYLANGAHMGACTPGELDPIINICHKNEDGSYQNNSIKTSEWPTHQAHGDHQGSCTADELDQNITVCHNNGDGTKQNMVIKQSAWMTHSIHGDHLGACTADELDGVVTICHKNTNGSVQTMTIKNSEWATHQAHGDHKGVCTQEELDPTIVICHIENGVKQKINIPTSKWPIHQAHGDNLGLCVNDEIKVITICHKQGGSAQTISINESEWPSHQAHGDHLGACNPDELDPIITICHQIPGNTPQTLNIKTSEWPMHQAHGDHLKACTDEETDPTIAICHKVGNGTSQNMNIKTSQWATHQSHGDHMGACSADELDPTIVICHKNTDGSAQNMNIKMSEWPSHAGHGDHQGVCTADELDPQIQICHNVTPDVKQTMFIKLSEWSSHQAHGDILGSCPTSSGTAGDKKLICHKKEDGTWETIYIPRMTWPVHQGHGDYEGTCKPNNDNKSDGKLDDSNKGGGNQLNNGGTNGGGQLNNGGGNQLNNGGGEIKSPGTTEGGGMRINNGGTVQEPKKPETQTPAQTGGGDVIRPR